MGSRLVLFCAQWHSCMTAAAAAGAAAMSLVFEHLSTLFLT